MYDRLWPRVALRIRDATKVLAPVASTILHYLYVWKNVTQSELKNVLTDEQPTFYSLSVLGLNRSSVWNAENHLLHRVLS